jgi:hypothetical protein
MLSPSVDKQTFIVVQAPEGIFIGKNKSDSERLSPLRSNFRCSVKAEPDRGIMRISDPPRCVINRKFVRLPWSRFTKDGFVNDELFVGAEWCERGG